MKKDNESTVGSRGKLCILTKAIQEFNTDEYERRVDRSREFVIAIARS